MLTEAVSRQQSYTSLLKDQVRDFRRIFPSPLDVREDVKSALWFLATETWNAVQPVHDGVPTALVLRDHFIHFVLWTGDRLDAGELGEMRR